MPSPLAASSAWSGAEIFSFATGVNLAALGGHLGARAAQGKKPHQGIFSNNPALRVGEIWAKWPGTHQDSETWWRNTASGSALDANGNTVSDVQSRSYSWDFENRLTQAVVPGTNGGTTTFKYDPFGRRIYKQSSSFTSIFLYDGPNPIQTMDSSGAEIASYMQGLTIDNPLAELRASTADYYEADGLGSITSLSNTSGSIAESYTFDSFGNTTASTGTLQNYFEYTAREFDPETSLYFYRARYYDPTAGRFISEDPASFRADIDFYRYVFNSPVDFGDPLGLQSGGNANSWTMGEIGSWAWLPQHGYPPPPGLGNAKVSIGAACALNGGGCNAVDASGATDPITSATWNNIVNASGTDQSGGGNFMCVGSQGCWFVHRCYKCVNGKKTRVSRPQPLQPSGTVSVGQHTIYFYNDPLLGWCNASDSKTGCHCK